MKRWLLALLLLLAACQRPAPPPLTHEAYIWQRVWTPAVVNAMRDAPVHGWRVLALQVVGTTMRTAGVDLAALAASARPVRAVIRIEGSRLPIDVATLGNELGPLLERWRAAGVLLVGIEIDHDCASAALADYSRWLTGLRTALPADLPLSITALPAWLDSPALETLLAGVDHSILQVHAVQRPQQGLYDPDQALRWIRAWDRRSARPFLAALPAYGVRVRTDASGALLTVDAEGEIDRSGSAGVEMRVEPPALARLLDALTADRPAQFDGIVWFRLPLPGDRRALSHASWAALIAASPLRADWRVQSNVQTQGSVDLWLHNAGNLDARPPPVELPVSCRFADALPPYRLHQSAVLTLQPEADAWLRAGQRLRIGWARCSAAPPTEWSLP